MGRQSYHARLRGGPESNHRCDEPDLEGCEYQKLLVVRSACRCCCRSMDDDYRASQVGPGQADRRQDLSAGKCCRGTSVPCREPPIRTGARHDIARILRRTVNVGGRTMSATAATGNDLHWEVFTIKR